MKNLALLTDCIKETIPECTVKDRLSAITALHAQGIRVENVEPAFLNKTLCWYSSHIHNIPATIAIPAFIERYDPYPVGKKGIPGLFEDEEIELLPAALPFFYKNRFYVYSPNEHNGVRDKLMEITIISHEFDFESICDLLLPEEGKIYLVLSGQGQSACPAWIKETQTGKLYIPVFTKDYPRSDELRLLPSVQLHHGQTFRYDNKKYLVLSASEDLGLAIAEY